MGQTEQSTVKFFIKEDPVIPQWSSFCFYQQVLNNKSCIFLIIEIHLSNSNADKVILEDPRTHTRGPPVVFFEAKILNY